MNRLLLRCILIIMVVTTAAPAVLPSILPATVAHAQTTVDFTNTSGSASQYQGLLEQGNTFQELESNPVCPSWYDLGCQIVVGLVYDLWFSITQRLARFTAMFADYTLNLSLQSWVYHNSDFIVTGWTIMRDIANLAFIGGLLYAAFRLMMGDGTGKKLVFKVIIFALVINFSLFLTQIVVDGGNILARSIYQSIEVVGASGGFAENTGVIQISTGIVNKLNPQAAIQGQTASLAAADGRQVLGIFLFVAFISGVINVMLIFMFITMALIFIGRTIGLMLLMILVPLTVLSELIPPIKNGLPIKYLKLDGWINELWGLTLTAPIYIFFLYLTILFYDASTAGSTFQAIATSDDWVSKLVLAIIPTALVFFLLKAAGDVTKKLSGELGGMITNISGAALGAVAGLAMGFAGGVMARGAGAVGSALQKSGADSARKSMRYNELVEKQKKGELSTEEAAELKSFGKMYSPKMASSFGNSMMNLGAKAKAQNFDMRKLNIGGLSVSDQLQSAGLGSYAGMGGLGAAATASSFDEAARQRAEAEAQRIKMQSDLIRKSMDAADAEKKKKITEYEDGDDAEKINKKGEAKAKELKDGKNDIDLDEAKQQAQEAEKEIKAAREKAKDPVIQAQEANPDVKRFRELQKKIADGTATSAEVIEHGNIEVRVGSTLQASGVYTAPEEQIKAAEKKLETALSNMSLDELTKMKTDLADDKDAKSLREKLEKTKRDREAEAEKIEASVKDGTYVENEAKKYNTNVKKSGDASKEINSLSAENAKLQSEINKLQSDISNGLVAPGDMAATQDAITTKQNTIKKNERKISANQEEVKKADKKIKAMKDEHGDEFVSYANTKAELEKSQKDTEKYIKQYQKQEIEKLTKFGKQFISTTLKGLGIGLVAGLLTGGVGTALVGSGYGGLAGALVGSTQELQSMIAKLDHQFLETSYKQELRNQIRGKK
jgi:hypothetical protein